MRSFYRKMWVGILRLEFDETGNLNLTVESKEDDFFFDEIGSDS